jgi:hypothetical protein
VIPANGTVESAAQSIIVRLFTTFPVGRRKDTGQIPA